jgi:hypothetical protein
MVRDNLISAIFSPRNCSAPAFRKIETTFVAILFPKQAQAACHRKGSHHRENGVAGVGFDNFKEAFDGLSHMNVSLDPATRALLSNMPLDRFQPRKQCRDMLGVPVDFQPISKLWIREFGAQILLNG